jgi:hypothetical protein
MAYDPDKNLDILQSKKVFVRADRQEPYDHIVDALSRAGMGVTQNGDRLTVRGLHWQASFVLLEVELDRDTYIPENK